MPTLEEMGYEDEYPNERCANCIHSTPDMFCRLTAYSIDCMQRVTHNGFCKRYDRGV